MMKFGLFLLAGLGLVALSQAACRFPGWLIMPKRYRPSRYEENWETYTRLTTTPSGANLNGVARSRTLVSVSDSVTLSIRWQEDGQTVNREKYTCSEGLENHRYVLMGDGHFRCVSFKLRSYFVAQWSLGSEVENADQACVDREISWSDWPLVYFPVRDVEDKALFKDVLERYQACPDFGGYLMSVYQENGNLLSNCSNSHPTPRIEFECGAGEGVLLSPGSGDCSRYDFTRSSIGSKLNCLGHWKDEKYSYSVLVPAHKKKINSFHCLRVNKDDPTREDAVLFLDNICTARKPNAATESFLLLRLRRKNIKKICDDYIDSCTHACEQKEHRYVCPSTCGGCNVPKPQAKIAKPFTGEWTIHSLGRDYEITINEGAVTLPGLGQFTPYSTSWGSACIRVFGFEDGKAGSYMLVQRPEKGCRPRVMQFRAERKTDSVIVVSFPGTSPLRAESVQLLTPSNWCRNNELEVKAWARTFEPYWPETDIILKNYDAGWQTLVRRDRQVEAPCNIDPQYANMAAELVFNTPEGGSYKCRGRTRLESSTSWSIDYNDCQDNVASRSVTFTCLAQYTISTDFNTTILKTDEKLSDTIQRTKYYCLLIPSRDYREHFDPMLDTAGHCDLHFAGYSTREQSVVKPLLTFKHNYTMEYSGSSQMTATKGGLLSVLILSLTYLMS